MIFFFVHISILQTVFMATNNRKDNHGFAIFHLFASFSRVNLGKICRNVRQSGENDFGQYFNF